MSGDIESKVRSCLEKLGPYQGWGSGRPLNELPGWDSLRSAEFIIALQKEFKIGFTVPQMLELKSVDVAINQISSILADKST